MSTINITGTSLEARTGTGLFVGSDSPTFTGVPIAPTLELTNANCMIASGTNYYIKDLNNKTILLLRANVNAINYVTISNSSTGNPVIISTVSSNTNQSVRVLSVGNAGVGIQGQTTGNFGYTGSVGELITTSFASGISLTSGTIANVQSITLTAGNWNVWAFCAFVPDVTTTLSATSAGLNLTTNTLPAPTSVATASIINFNTIAPAGVPVYLNTGIYPIAVSTNTSMFLNAKATFTISTCTASGIIFARRIS